MTKEEPLERYSGVRGVKVKYNKKNNTYLRNPFEKHYGDSDEYDEELGEEKNEDNN